MTRILILGGTSDANALAQEVHRAGFDAIYSYAGRTKVPANQPLPVRTGGFGGIDGIVGYIRSKGITHVVDATHAFANIISNNVVAACRAANIPLMALVRPEWQARADDDWRCVADLEAAVEALPLHPVSVFLAIGRQHLEPFAAKPQHRYVLRFIDEPQGALPLPTAEVIIARGPFKESDDLALMRSRSVTWLVTRNSGADGARAKVDAARTLGVPVIMISRPAMPEYEWVANVDAVMAWLHHECRLGA